MSRTHRQEARVLAARAAQAWLDVVGESLAAFVRASGLAGADGLVVFTGAVARGGEGPGAREVLTRVCVASGAGRRDIHPDAGDTWFEAVDIWDHLRRAAELAYLTEIPVSLVVDLDHGAVTCWEPVHCPEEAAEPEFSFSLADRDVPTWDMDPVDALVALALDDADRACLEVEWRRRARCLLERYGVPAPSIADPDPEAGPTSRAA